MRKSRKIAQSNPLMALKDAMEEGLTVRSLPTGVQQHFLTKKAEQPPRFLFGREVYVNFCKAVVVDGTGDALGGILSGSGGARRKGEPNGAIVVSVCGKA